MGTFPDLGREIRPYLSDASPPTVSTLPPVKEEDDSVDLARAKADLNTLIERRARVEADLLMMADDAEGGG